MANYSSAMALSSIGQLGQALIANYFTGALERDRDKATRASVARANLLRDKDNEATAALSTTQRWLQSQRNQRLTKNAEQAFAQGQEAIAALSRGATEATFQAQINASREAGANAARSAASGVSGDATPVELAQTLATARVVASMRERAAQETDDLTIRSSRAAAAGPIAGDLTTLLPGLDRRINLAPAARYRPHVLSVLLSGVSAAPRGEVANLLAAGSDWGQQAADWAHATYNNHFTNNAQWGMEDR